MMEEEPFGCHRGVSGSSQKQPVRRIYVCDDVSLARPAFVQRTCSMPHFSVVSAVCVSYAGRLTGPGRMTGSSPFRRSVTNRALSIGCSFWTATLRACMLAFVRKVGAGLEDEVASRPTLFFHV
jgi:hypothetical protein